MGNCSNLCSRIIIPNSDVPVSVPTYKQNNNKNISKYSKEPNISKIIYIQSRLRNFFRKKKKSIKYSKNNTNTKTRTNTNLNNSNYYSKSKSIKKTSTNHNNVVNYQKKKTNKKNEIKKNKTLKEDDSLNIPQVRPMFKRNKFFSEDPFSKPNKKESSKDLLNDPRNGPIDNLRRKFPKIEQDEFSYEGEWKNRKRDGLGVLIWKGVAKFIGQFVEDRVIGFGLLYHDDGDEYIGYWNEFQAHGLGIYKTKKVLTYEGYWEHDKQNGFGIEKWPRNTWFKGGYLEGNKEGYGMLSIEDKGIYEGEMKNGNINGIGKFTFRDGRKYEGEFRNNKMNGYGILNWPDGKLFVGEFKEDIQEGFGVFYSRKKTYIGIWKNTLLEGEAIVVENDKIKKQFWEEGRPSENLSNEHKIFFEKYVDDIIKQKEYFASK